ncbi:hypothetical protein EGY16_32855 [Burkholderia pseudomallei]|uniref:hypothetical protein n=1 Tax=Burkholderia pseudomallei TaxID=28450 RepID=UPI000F4F27B8|nr:hypothetical protein [Burkholderia pseudomallei]AYX32620.1 hypothetical protein EGY16_32855 [Burkholderia pseudomallei]
MKTHNGLVIERGDGLIAVPAQRSDCRNACVFKADAQCRNHACFGDQFPDTHECSKHKYVIWIRPQ